MGKKLVMKNWVYTAIFCFAVIFGAFAIYSAVMDAFVILGVWSEVAETIARFAAGMAVLAVYGKVFGLQEFGLGKKNFFRGMLTGGFMFFVCVLNVLAALAEYMEYPVVMPPVSLIIMVVIEQLFVGLFEEFLFRGFLLHTLLVKFGENKFSGKMAAVFISSLIFGLAHFINLNEQMLNETISQVCSSAFVGIFFGVLYLRVRNIWVVVCYHALTNYAGDLTAIFFDFSAAPAVDVGAGDILMTILANMVLLFVSLFLARKLKT